MKRASLVRDHRVYHRALPSSAVLTEVHAPACTRQRLAAAVRRKQLAFEVIWRTLSADLSPAARPEVASGFECEVRGNFRKNLSTQVRKSPTGRRSTGARRMKGDCDAERPQLT